mgnify:CR=1 FL=1
MTGELTAAAVVAVLAGLGGTLVPALIPIFVRGKLSGEEDNWIVRSFIHIYKPVLTWLMHVPAAGIWFAWKASARPSPMKMMPIFSTV